MLIEAAELRDPARQLLAGAGQDPWPAMVEAGWTALNASEAAGGLEQPLAAACWLYEEIGYALSAAPLLPSLLAVDVLQACPQGGARDGWIEKAVAGEAVAVALLESSTAKGELSNGKLTARIKGVQGASKAEHLLLVLAEPALVAVVPLKQAGVVVEPRALWDTTRDMAEVVFEGAPLDDGTILARDAAARAAAVAASVHLHFAIAADCVGAADALLEQTVAYLQTRRQFDRPLAMFQALKHRCADLKALTAGASALLADRLKALEAGGHDPVALARMTKSLASRTFRAVAEDAVQLHGGIGMTAEHPCHRYLKRALLNEHLAGADDACDLAVAATALGALGG